MKTELSKQQKTELRGRLMEYIAVHAVKDKLPPERELMKALGVNWFPLRQCLDDMQKENIIVKKPRRGSFLVNAPAGLPKIGIIISDGQNSPYVRTEFLSAFLTGLERHNVSARFLNFKDAANLPSMLRQYDLQGCVWVNISAAAVSRLPDFPDDFLRKTVFYTYGYADLDALTGRFPRNCVGRDRYKAVDTRLNDFLAAGRGSIAYLSSYTNCYDYFVQRLNKLGLKWDDERFIENAAEIPARLPYLRRKYGIDAILCNGGEGFYENLFATLAGMRGYRPFLSVANNLRSRFEMAKYSDTAFVLPEGWDAWREEFVTAGVCAEQLMKIIAAAGEMSGNIFVNAWDRKYKQKETSTKTKKKE